MLLYKHKQHKRETTDMSALTNTQKQDIAKFVAAAIEAADLAAVAKCSVWTKNDMVRVYLNDHRGKSAGHIVVTDSLLISTRTLRDSYALKDNVSQLDLLGCKYDKI